MRFPTSRSAMETGPVPGPCSTGRRLGRPSTAVSPGHQIGNHSAYKTRDLRIEYPWHPLFGRVLRARDGGRRQGAASILVEERPGFFRTLPPWMCDPAYCARLESGSPLVAVEALEALARTLELMRRFDVAPSSGTAIPEEDTHVPPTPPATGAALPSPRRQPESSAGGAIYTGNSGGAGGAAAGGCGHDDGGLAK